MVTVLGMALLSLDSLLISKRVWQVGELALSGPWQFAHLSGMGAGLSSCLAGRADMVACVVFTSTELASDLLSAYSGVVSKALAGIALAVGLCVSVCSTAYLHCSYM